MLVYRITKTPDCVEDISGFGALKFGGRWNNKGTYMLYTSMNSSLAYLESLVHFNETEVPPNLYITEIKIADDAPVYQLPDEAYPALWQIADNTANKIMGDQWMRDKKFLAFKVKSAINPFEFNFLLNPLFPGYRDIVTIKSINRLNIDARLAR